jgi:hypothetical protein
MMPTDQREKKPEINCCHFKSQHKEETPSQDGLF